MEIKDLIQGCQDANRECQSLLVRRFSSRLFTICRRYARDEAMAHDFLQESWIRIFSNINRYKPHGSFYAWMHTITVRSALQCLEKKYYKNEFNPEKDSILEKLSSPEPDIFSTLATEEIIKCLQQLPDGFRSVINLSIIEGYAHKEIAQILQISENTSRSQLQRARKKLQKMLHPPTLKTIS